VSHAVDVPQKRFVAEDIKVGANRCGMEQTFELLLESVYPGAEHSGGGQRRLIKVLDQVPQRF
jgi:hypothetical protein